MLLRPSRWGISKKIDRLGLEDFKKGQIIDVGQVLPGPIWGTWSIQSTTTNVLLSLKRLRAMNRELCPLSWDWGAVARHKSKRNFVGIWLL